MKVGSQAPLGIFGEVIDHTPDCARVITKRAGTPEHLNAVYPLDPWVVVTTITDE